MSEQFRFRNKIIFTLLLIYCLTFCFLNLEFFIVNFGDENKNDRIILEKTNLKSSIISERIIIENNWSDARDAGICTGSGTFSDPYIIKDLVITGGGIGVGILVVDSKKDFFRIENCIILNCSYGIRLLRSCNGTLLNNNCSHNDIGIYLDGWTDDHHFTHEEFLTFYCMNNSISNNIINNNEDYGIYCHGGPSEKNLENNTIKGNLVNYNRYGIYFLAFCNNNTILDNILFNNEAPGIFLEGPCYDNKFTGNLMKQCGFYSHYSHFFSNTINTTNFVNDGHLYFYANSTGLNNNNFSNAGQIMLFNCNNSIISNLDLSNGSVSLSLTECNNMEISYNNLSSNNMWGIELSNCDNISIVRNIINENRQGIDSYNLDNSVILENEINKNGLYGIYINGHNNLISRNNINNNLNRGLEIRFFCENNTIFDNNIENNLIGLFLINSFSNISENVISRNMDVGLYLGGGSYNNTIFINFFRNNGLHVSGATLNQNWNNSEIGNYWDNYTGADEDGDGIGDTPHMISSSPIIQDHLPIVENDPPGITIIKPANNSKIGSLAPNFEVKVNERFLDIMWYTLDGGLHNFTFTENGTIDQATWNVLPEGPVPLRFYAIDKAGNIAFKEITIYKRVSNQDTLLIIILSTVLGTVGIISVAIIILVRKKFKLRD